MLDGAGERRLGLFGVVVDIAGGQEQRLGGFAMLRALHAAMHEAGRGTEVGWIECHVSGPSRHVGPTVEQLEPAKMGLLAGLFSALVSPRRNPAGQITRTGSIPMPADRTKRAAASMAWRRFHHRGA